MSILSRAGAELRAAFRANPGAVPTASMAMASRDMGRVGKTNVKMFRSWSEHSEWVRGAINIRKGQVSSAEWDIVQWDPDGREPDKGLAREIRDRLEFANPKAESWRTFIEQVVEDILVLDAGSIEIEPNFKGEPLFFHPVDGGTIRVSQLWDGDPDEPRYFWYPDGFERARWRNDEFIYIMETPRTNSVVGLSKLETLKLSIDSELEGHAYNARQIRNPTPEGLLYLGKGANQNRIDGFRAMWTAEQGLGGGLAITGGTDKPEFVKFHDNNQDMQFLEWQLYLVRKIATVFGMHIMDLNFGEAVNRSTAETQDQQTENRGLRTLLDLIKGHFTREVVWHPSFGGQANNLCFRFTNLNLRESLARAQVNKIAVSVPYDTVNSARKREGLEPLEGDEFNYPIAMTPQGAFLLKDVPSMREFLDAKKPAPKPAGGPPAVVREVDGDEITGADSAPA